MRPHSLLPLSLALSLSLSLTQSLLVPVPWPRQLNEQEEKRQQRAVRLTSLDCVFALPIHSTPAFTNERSALNLCEDCTRPAIPAWAMDACTQCLTCFPAVNIAPLTHTHTHTDSLSLSSASDYISNRGTYYTCLFIYTCYCSAVNVFPKFLKPFLSFPQISHSLALEHQFTHTLTLTFDETLFEGKTIDRVKK